MLDFLCVKRFIALFLAMLLMAPIAAAAQAPQSDAASLQAQGTQPAQAQQDIASAIPDAPLPQQTQPPAQPAAPPPSDSAPLQSTTTPVGTAAAPSEKPVGVAGSRPAGAVIAPAKQRRVRTILISIGVIVGAGIAVGTVAALSHASPSQPH